MAAIERIKKYTLGIWGERRFQGGVGGGIGGDGKGGTNVDLRALDGVLSEHGAEELDVVHLIVSDTLHGGMVGEGEGQSAAVCCGKLILE